HPRNLMPGRPVGTEAQEDALFAVGQWVAEHGIDAPGEYRAVRNLLLRRPPRAVGEVLEEPAYLAVQGPPGSGKTTYGARLVADLVAAHKRVGITAHSHAVIGNLLDAIVERAAEEGVTVRAMQKADDHQACSSEAVEVVRKNEEVFAAIEDRL